jgi:hypothetical protein
MGLGSTLRRWETMRLQGMSLARCGIKSVSDSLVKEDLDAAGNSVARGGGGVEPCLVGVGRRTWWSGSSSGRTSWAR